MFSVTVQQMGEAIVLGCKGRIVFGNAYSTLSDAVCRQGQARMLILDLARVDRIDAGGLGILLSVREWTRSGAVRFKLMNVTGNVEQTLELTNLQRVFEFCSVRDLLCLLHCEASMKSWSDCAHQSRENDSHDGRVEGWDDVSAVPNGVLFAAAP